MKNSKTIYSLSVEDIQTVALQEIERNLSPKEIEKIKKSVADKINWYDAIANSINEKIKV
jgi:DNA replicative helicase MCM subunit Mcm2 (Cdc46/Mcm family)